MARFALWTCLVLSLASCGGRRRRQPPTLPDSTAATRAPVASAVRAHGTPREQLEQFDGVMRESNLEPVSQPARGELGPDHAIETFPIDVERNHCYALAVFGAPGMNVDLVLLDPLGRNAAHDVRPDEHPWVSFCAARGGRFMARIQLAAGQGEYYFAPYHGRTGAALDLTAFFGGATAAPAAAALDPVTTARIRSLDAQLAAERLTRVGEATGARYEAHSDQAYRLNLQRGTCYAFAVFGGPGTSDTDALLFNAAGERLAADEGPGQDALVRHCATEDAEHRLQVRLPGGAGPVFTVAYVASAGGAPSTSAPVVAASSGGSLDENFALLDSDMRARGYAILAPMSASALASGAASELPVELEANKCYAFLGIGDGGVRTLRLELLDATGREVEHDEQSSRATVRYCTTTAGSYRARLVAASGEGRVALGSYRWPRGILGPFGLEGLTYVRFSEMAALLEAEGFQFDANFAPQQSRIRRQGQSSTQTFTLQPGFCYSVLVAGGSGIRDLDGRLRVGETEVDVQTGSVGAFLSLRHCVEGGAASVGLEVTAVQGSGSFVSQIFQRAAR